MSACISSPLWSPWPAALLDPGPESHQHVTHVMEGQAGGEGDGEQEQEGEEEEGGKGEEKQEEEEQEQEEQEQEEQEEEEEEEEEEHLCSCGRPSSSVRSPPGRIPSLNITDLFSGLRAASSRFVFKKIFFLICSVCAGAGTCPPPRAAAA